MLHDVLLWPALLIPVQRASTERRALVVILSAAFLLGVVDYAGPRIRAALDRRRERSQTSAGS
jgi:hypothetical protein